MGTNPCSGVLLAMELLKKGTAKTGIEAAAIAQIHRDTLYRHPPYKLWRIAIKNYNRNIKQGKNNVLS
mgnify:CR=1 FL=1